MLLEHIQAFTHSTGLPKSLWGEVLRHSTWLKNCTAMRALNSKTPFEVLYGQPPDLSALWPWGCDVFVHDVGHLKLDVCARTAHWLGFDVNSCAHRVYWPGTGTVTVERNIYFGLSAQLEGEGSNTDLIIVDRSEQPDSPTPTSSSLSTPSPSSAPSPPMAPALPEEPAASPVTPKL